MAWILLLLLLLLCECSLVRQQRAVHLHTHVSRSLERAMPEIGKREYRPQSVMRCRRTKKKTNKTTTTNRETNYISCCPTFVWLHWIARKVTQLVFCYWTRQTYIENQQHIERHLQDYFLCLVSNFLLHPFLNYTIDILLTECLFSFCLFNVFSPFSLPFGSSVVLCRLATRQSMQDFTLDFYFRQFWTDPRLAYRKRPGVETLSVGSEFIKNIWVPDTFFVNEKQSYFHIATTSNEFIRVHHSGSITRSIR